MTDLTAEHDRTLCPWVSEALPLNNLPEWIRTTLVAGDGALFVPAVVAPGGETAATLNSMHDRMPPVRFRGHAYVSIQWLRDQYPQRHKLLELLDLIERRIRTATAEAEPGTQDGPGGAPEALCHD